MNYSKTGARVADKVVMLRFFLGASLAVVLNLVIATFFAMLLVACSDRIAEGGSSEEPCVQASLENITIAGMANNTVVRMVNARTEDSTTFIQNYNINVAAKKGTIVTALELDSITLDTTERFFVGAVLNDSGDFAFKNISLQSPYVRIRVQDSCLSETANDNFPVSEEDSIVKHFDICRTFDAIVDVREIKEINVNLLTHIKSFKLRELVESGIPFATANKQAEQEILESFGVYEKIENFESLNSKTRSELSYLNQLAAERPITFFDLDPNTSSWYFIKILGLEEEFKYLVVDYENDLKKDSAQESFAEWLKKNYSGWHMFRDDLYADLENERSRINYFGYIPLTAYSSSEEKKRLYMETLKLIEYELNFLAKRAGLERCTEQREGDVERRERFDFVCRSGKWQYGYKWIDHANGTMTDNRDGKIYNTVTYNIGGKLQTWMAENLNYDGNSLSADPVLNANLKGSMGCYAGDESSCAVNGRMYEWRAAMNFDDKALKVFMKDSADTILVDEKCKHQFDDYGRCRVAKSNECNNAFGKVQRMCSELYGGKYWIGFWDWNYTELLDGADPSNYQGVCPDGWRLPTAKDWKALAQFVIDQYGTDTLDVSSILFDEVATGFGVKKLVQVEGNAGNLMISVLGNPAFVAVPDFETMPHTFTFDDLIFAMHSMSTITFGAEEMQYLNVENVPTYEYDFAYIPYFVRCVKD